MIRILETCGRYGDGYGRQGRANAGQPPTPIAGYSLSAERSLGETTKGHRCSGNSNQVQRKDFGEGGDLDSLL